MSDPILMNLAVMNVLAWTPFLDPIDIHRWWYISLLPLAFGVAVTYKAVRVPSFDDYWKQVFTLTAQIVLGIVGLTIATWMFVLVILPRIAPVAS